MVVKYYDQSRVAYGDRNFFGVLAAGEGRSKETPSDSDREIDRFLRFSEPPEHDEWESTENLREQYQRGFRTALDDMFGTLRDGLRHLISKVATATLSDNVLNRFPIHGGGDPDPRRRPPIPSSRSTPRPASKAMRGRSLVGLKYSQKSSTDGVPTFHSPVLARMDRVTTTFPSTSSKSNNPALPCRTTRDVFTSS